MALFTQQDITPAVKDHINAQSNFLRESTQKMFEAFQKINRLQMDTAQAIVQESLSTFQQALTANDPLEAVSIAAGQVQPNAEKVRSYQQQLTNIAAGTQVDLARTAESHVPETSRTAAAMADDVARRAAEETERTRQRQRAAMERVTAPPQQPGQQPQRGGEAKGATRAGA